MRRQAIARSHRWALPKHIERDALADLALRCPVLIERPVRVRMQVDVSGRDDEAGGVDHTLGGGIWQLAHGRNAIPLEADIAVEIRVAGAVHDLAAAYEHVIRGVLRCRGLLRRRPACSQSGDSQRERGYQRYPSIHRLSFAETLPTSVQCRCGSLSGGAACPGRLVAGALMPIAGLAPVCSPLSITTTPFTTL